MKITGTLVWTLIGYAALSTWFYVVGYSNAFSLLNGSTAQTTGRFLFFASCLMFVIMFCIFDRAAEKHRRGLNIAIPFTLFIGTAMLGLANNQTLINQTVFGVIACVIMGCGYTWYLLSFYRVAAQYGTLLNWALLFILHRAISSIVIVSIVYVLPAPLQVVFAAFLALLIVVALAFAQRSVDNPTDNPRKVAPLYDEREKTIGRHGLTHIARLILVTSSMVILRGLGTGGIWGRSPNNLSSIALGPIETTAIVVVLFFLIAFSTLALCTIRSQKICDKIPILILVVGILGMVALGFTAVDTFIEHALYTSLELYSQTLFSFYVVVGIRTLPFSPFRVAGAALGFSFLLPMLWMAFFEGSEVATGIILLVTSLSLIIFLVFSNAPEQTGTQAASLRGNSNNDIDLYEAILIQGAVLAKQHKLTERETEILLLLLQGRNLPHIQEKLVLASGTVRTHVNKIYKKLDVHSRQELLDLLTRKETEEDQRE